MSQWSRVLDPTVPVVRPCCPVYSTGEDVRMYVRTGKGARVGLKSEEGFERRSYLVLLRSP